MRDLDRWIGRENRIYIMPTAGGALYLSLIVVLILTASTYNNNLIFILAFFMFAVFIVSMLQTHYNLKGVRLQYIGAEEGFEGDAIGMNFYLQQKKAQIKKSLQVRTRSKLFPTLLSHREDLEPQDSLKSVRIEVRAVRRGRHKLPTMSLETRYPLGLFRAWKIFRPEGQIIVYPNPEKGVALMPVAFDQGEQDVGLRSSPDGDFGELKRYSLGESYHQIAWKHYARTGHLFIKVHWGAEDRHYQIPWRVGPDLEKDLRHMSAWVRQAVEENASFEMETPETTIPPGRGLEHGRECWRALALIPPQEAS